MKSSRMRGVRGGLMAFATMAIAACGGSDNGSGESIGAPKSDRIGHVFLIVLENKNYDRTFGPDTEAPYLGTELPRSEEHTSELQSLMRISYAVFCLKKKRQKKLSIKT